MKLSTLTVSFLLSVSLLCGEDKVDFNRDIRPILSSKCFACHGPDEAERGADLRLDSEDGSRLDRDGTIAIVPGDPKASELIYRVTAEDDSEIMPPKKKGEPLSPKEVALLERWIREGGNYARHWSYEKPVLPVVPESGQHDWPVNNPIDAFIQEKLASAGLAPSARADRLTLARRAALDLTGLPPTWEQAQSFVNDPVANAWEKYVDSLLASPAFGERWAQVWLDLARYADSAGYADDPGRTIWGYRDWVIRAFNQNMPFDQFTIEQIAGDLLENPQTHQLIATAFHRNTLTNNEGGTNDEEFRNVAVVDRVNTTMEVWMGTTMACAQCHTHKFDPITQDEYFQMFDYFNQSEDADRRDESPFLEVWSDQQVQQKKSWEQEITQLKDLMSRDTPELTAAREAWLASLSREPLWKALPLQEAKGAKLVAGDDGWIRLEGDLPEKATYTLKFPTENSEITGVQLAISPQQKQNFVVSQIKASWKPTESNSLNGRYVRVELNGPNQMIHLAEIEVFSAGVNVARSGTVTQSSTDFGGPANLAVDGITNGDFNKKSVTHTAVGTDPWIQVDLGKTLPIDSFKIWNRTDGGTETRLTGYQVKILDDNNTVVWEQVPKDVPKPSTSFALSGAIDLKFQSAFASHEQSGFSAAATLTDKPTKKDGWAIAGAVGKEVDLTLLLARPLKVAKGILTVTLAQESEFKSHVLSHFRVATTSDPGVTDWSRMTGEVRDLIKKGDTKQPQIISYHRSIAKELAPQRATLASLEKQLKEAKPETTVPVMRDLPENKRRVTNLQIRGNYQNTGHVVKKAVPAAFHPLKKDLPNNRLALAHWLVDSENPLTARVTVNRFWEHMFGTGIVQTSEEFGSQGDQPTHPELLDWLAVNFQKNGWDVKALLRLMVMSATYQQETGTTSELLKVDPFNRLYARGPRFRISSEMVRDQALFVSGLLSEKKYGPPVNPPQPNLGLSAAFGGSTDWKTSMGEDKFRRGIYTSWRRSSPYASMATFDSPNREICISRRGRTNTPLQALVTLNDPVYVEAAQALARKMLTQGGESIEQKLTYGWRTALLRDPSPQEMARMTDLINQAKARYSEKPDEAQKMATDPIGPVPNGSDPAELAAWTVAGNVLLNLDEIFLKR